MLIKKMVKPIIIILITLVLALLIIILVSNPNITSLSISSQEASSNNPNLYSWTKAICNENNYCQDYEIECNGQELTKMSPITGASIQNSKTWQDPRTLEQRIRVCDY